ncbi:hypothetical protein AQUCO_03400016v1 [Aquilegia coerulea]|uniref:Uncharacterized protein n=1 Tax=Aquilegia coerulea TaxID=218851 RepID=A0A2G5CX40_AQUCA|nr:hypothetical protein AQUCO_03400016v1 [Aquilegia coerulea]
MASISLSSLSSSFSSLSFSSQVSPKSQKSLSFSLPTKGINSKTPSLTIVATSATVIESPLESETLSIEKYVKSRLPGGFAAQNIIGTGRRKCAIARVVLQEGISSRESFMAGIHQSSIGNFGI